MAGTSILVIEDDLSTLELIGSILNKAGYDPTLVNTAGEGLKWLKEHTPSLIILDYMLPDLNGSQFLDKLKKGYVFEIYKDVPVILLTAYLDLENELENLLNDGVGAYLFKPFARSELLQIVDNVLTTNQLKRQSKTFEKTINQIHRLEDDPYFSLPFSVIYLDKDLFVKNMNPKAIEEFGRILGEIDDVPLPTLLERNAVHSTRELQKILFNFPSSAVSYMDFFYTPGGVQQAQVTVLESQHHFMEHQYVIIVDFLRRDLKAPDEIVELISWFEIFPLGILLLDSKFTLLHANHLAKNLLGITPQTNMAGFFKSRCLPLLSGPMEYVMHKKNPYFLQQHALLPDSKKLFDIVLLHVEKKETQLIVLFSDYYSRETPASTHPVPDESEADDENPIRLNYDFLRKFAHDMRTPLNSIQGFSKIIMQNNAEKLEAQDVQDLESIQKSGLIVNTMLEKLMDYARIQKNDLHQFSKSLDVNLLIKKAIKKMDVLARSFKVNIETDLNDLPMLKTDETIINRIILYIMENAIMYSVPEKNLPVQVETGILDEKNIIIRVTDRGIGMTPDELIHCREAFYSGRLVEEKKLKGMGLGLYITTHFVDEIKGKMNIQSKIEEGTTVEIVLPIML